MSVGALRLLALVHRDESALLGPQAIHRGGTPVGTRPDRSCGGIPHRDPKRLGVSRGKDAQRYPPRLAELDIEGDRLRLTVRVNRGLGDGKAVLEQFDRDVPGLADSGALEVPRRSGVGREVPDRGERGVEIRTQPGSDHGAHAKRLPSLDRPSRGSALRVDLDLGEVGAPVAEVGARIPNAGEIGLRPVCAARSDSRRHVGATDTDPLVEETRIVGLAHHHQIETRIEDVVPRVQLVHRILLRRTDEVDRAVHHVDQCLVQPDGREARNLPVGQVVALDAHADAAVRVSGDGALGSRPLHDGQVPARPVGGRGGRGVLGFGETQQHRMPRMARREARHLEVVAEHRFGIPIGRLRLPAHAVRLLKGRMLETGERAHARTREELLLVVVAGAPVEHSAHVDRLTAHVPDHRLGRDSLRGGAVVRASGRVDVHVTGVVGVVRRRHPSGQGRLEGAGLVAHGELDLLFEVLRPASDGRGVGAGRKQDHLPRRTVDVILEEHVGGDAHLAGREDAPRAIPDRQTEGARGAIGLPHLEGDGDRRSRLELERGALMTDVHSVEAVPRADGQVARRRSLVASEDRDEHELSPSPAEDLVADHLEHDALIADHRRLVEPIEELGHDGVALTRRHERQAVGDVGPQRPRLRCRIGDLDEVVRPPPGHGGDPGRGGGRARVPRPVDVEAHDDVVGEQGQDGVEIHGLLMNGRDRLIEARERFPRESELTTHPLEVRAQEPDVILMGRAVHAPISLRGEAELHHVLVALPGSEPARREVREVG